MIKLVLPPLRERSLTMEADWPTRTASDPRDHEWETERERGERPPLAGRVAFGGPLAVPVTSDYVTDDPVLRVFVEREAAHSVYHLVHMSVSFAGEPATPRLDSVVIELTMSSTGGPEPVAWSMAPLRITDPVQIERGFRLGPNLKLQDLEVGVGEFEWKASSSRSEIFLQAHRELRADPAWEFRRTAAMALYGSHRLIMVVRSARDEATSVTGTIRAATKGNLLRRYRRDLPDPLSLAAVL